MECEKCGAEMFQTRIMAAPAGEIALVNKKKGIFESQNPSRISCYVCPECGYIELIADHPKDLQIL